MDRAERKTLSNQVSQWLNIPPLYVPWLLKIPVCMTGEGLTETGGPCC